MKNAKKKFLSQCLSHILQFGRHLKDALETVNLSLNLPDLAQLKTLRENIMNRVYPMVQEGRNTDDDILLSLSKIFFYENDYGSIPKLNSAIESSLQLKQLDEANLSTVSKMRKSTLLKCIISDVALVLLVFGGIYVLKYPVTISEYWTYLGSNAATVIGAIVASTLAVVLFFYRARSE